MLCEADDAVAVGDLRAPQVVLVLDALGVHRVPALAVAVPDVHRDTGERGSAVGQVAECELEGHRDAFGGAGGVTEAGSDVAAHDAALLEHVGPVGAVAGEGAGGLVGDLARRCGLHARAGVGPAASRVIAARSQPHAEGAEADSPQDRPAVENCLYVEPEALVLEILRGARQQPASPRRVACVPTAPRGSAHSWCSVLASWDERCPSFSAPSVFRESLSRRCRSPVHCLCRHIQRA